MRNDLPLELCVLNPEAAYKNAEEVATSDPKVVERFQTAVAEYRAATATAYLAQAPWFAGKTGNPPCA